MTCQRSPKACSGRFDPPTTVYDPGRVKTFFRPRNCTQPGAIHVDTTSEHIFAVASLESTRAQPEATPERSHSAHNSTRSSRLDRHQERFDADDVHYAREVVGEHVQLPSPSPPSAASSSESASHPSASSACRMDARPSRGVYASHQDLQG
jgi:hypothetical protein